MSHFNLNYHAAAFESVDSYLGSGLAILASPHTYFKDCLVCAKDTIAGMPGYLSQ